MSGFPIFSTTSSSRPKIHMTSAALPPYIDPAQPPTKRSPWRQIRETPFVRTATMVMPEQVYQQIITTSSSTLALLRPRYGRVMLTLTDILTNTDGWWSSSRTMMLSEGRPGVDDSRFEIREGKLRMELSKETYEKCGLQGQPLVGGGGGRKHVKARYEVQVDLREMMKKKGRGLDRVLWAARNVLDGKGPLCWLVVVDGDGGGGGDHEDEEEEEGPGSHGTTTWIEVEGATRSLRGVRVPEKIVSLVGEEGEQQQQQYEEDWYEMVEWLDMVALDSDGVKDDGRKDDSYVSRYKVPAGQADLTTTDLRVVRWAGLLPWTWIMALLIEIVKRSKATHVESWLALSVASHRTEAVRQIDGYTVVLQSTTSSSREEEQQEEEDEKEKDKGFQRSRCFQFVDSNIC